MEDLITFNDEPKAINPKLKRAQSLVGTSAGRDPSGADFYPTPPEATLALLEREPFEGTIWEPACGDGAMSRVFEGFGYKDIISTDLIHRGYGEGGHDFLASTTTANNVITNPPYSIAEPFIRKALAQTDKKVAMLVKLQFLEGQKRKALFETQPLKTVYV